MEYVTGRPREASGCRQPYERKRNGTVAFVDNRIQNVIQEKRIEEISKKQVNSGGNFQVIQGVLTRSRVRECLEAMKAGKASKGVFLKLDKYDQYIILSLAKEQGINVSEFQDILQSGDSAAEDNSDIDHPDCDDAQEYTESQISQFRRKAGLSGPKSNSLMTGIFYTRDADGNIDFSKPTPNPPLPGTWTNPVKSNSDVDLEKGGQKSGFGKMKNGNYVKISDASRSQHFSIANRVAEEEGKTYSSVARNSPDGFTWHHLIDKYKMVLVDRKTHNQFGHNGGFYFW